MVTIIVIYCVSYSVQQGLLISEKIVTVDPHGSAILPMYVVASEKHFLAVKQFTQTNFVALVFLSSESERYY